EEIVQSTLAAATQQQAAGSVCMLMPTPQGRDLRVVGAVGGNLPWAEHELLPLDPATVEWVTQARQQLSTWDGSSPLDVVSRPPFGARYHGVALPIQAGGNFYGVLCCGSPGSPRRLSPGQVKALDILANTAASAFEAASLLAQLRSMNQELEQRVEERT